MDVILALRSLPRRKTIFHKTILELIMTFDPYVISEVISEFNVNKCSYYIFRAITDNPDNRSTIVSRAYRTSLVAPYSPVKKKDCLNCIKDMEDRGIVRTMKTKEVREIQEALHREGIVGPILGLPSPRTIDFTLLGAEIWQRIERLLNPVKEFSVAVNTYEELLVTTIICSESREGALRLLRENDVCWKSNQVAILKNVSGPTVIGAWRDYWWRQNIPKGYIIEAEYKIDEQT